MITEEDSYLQQEKKLNTFLFVCLWQFQPCGINIFVFMNHLESSHFLPQMR